MTEHSSVNPVLVEAFLMKAREALAISVYGTKQTYESEVTESA